MKWRSTDKFTQKLWARIDGNYWLWKLTRVDRSRWMVNGVNADLCRRTDPLEFRSERGAKKHVASLASGEIKVIAVWAARSRGAA